MNDLTEDLRALLVETVDQPPHKTCGLATVLDSVTAEQADTLQVLLRDDCRVPSGNVAGTLQRWGFNVSYQAVQRHRRRHRGSGCTCP